MEIRKINVNTDKIKESKKRVKEELIDNPFIMKKMHELNVSDEEFDTYLGYFQTYLEDKMMCSKCKNPKKCSKQFEGIAMDLYRSEFGIERSFSLCPPRELERTVAKKYLLRDFPDAYLGIVLDDIDMPKGKIRFRQAGSAGTHNGLRDIVNKVGKHLFAFLGMHYFRMELYRVQILFGIFHCRHGTYGSMRNDFEICGSFFDIIGMAHPTDGCI